MEKSAVAAAVAALAGIGAWLLFRPREASATPQAKASQASKPASKPAATVPASPPAPSPVPAASTAPSTSSSVPETLPVTGRYETAMDAFGEPDWVKVSTLPGRLVTRLPLLTTGPERDKGITYARATDATTRRLAQRLGARMATTGEMQAITSAPEVRIVSACTFPSDNPSVRMESMEAARRVDACYRSKIGEAPKDGTIYLGIGKHWIETQIPGRTGIYGLYSRENDPKSLIQKGGTSKHIDSHVDYSQTVFLVKDLEAS